MRRPLLSQCEVLRRWELCGTEPDAIGSPAELDASAWNTTVDGPVATAGERDELDHRDWWMRKRFTGSQPRRLFLDGVATEAQVFCNGKLIAETHNMFRSYELKLEDLNEDNELVICCRALYPRLKKRRPRGRWPTRLVSQRHLRFFRTSLLGYMPGWFPEVVPVGLWRSARLADEAHVLGTLELRSRLEDNTGIVEVSCERSLTLRVGEREAQIQSAGTIGIPDVERWWPHTHGTPRLYPVTINIDTHEINLGTVGFRELDWAPSQQLGLSVNGEPIFCRGACWVPLDPYALHGDEATYRRVLERARDAGMNMIRVGGTMVYEHEQFYQLCDELGILVWQDFMFANFDYPTEPEHLAEVEQEARQTLHALGTRPSLAALCGNSEGSQQAIMMGQPLSAISSPIFDQLLPRLCAELAPDALYVPSTPSGGALPFHASEGPTHYYGVGAYLRPMDDARTTPLRFTTECLAFSNPPEDASLRRWLGELDAPAHHPLYKERVPRDPGAGWDFSDVTDHYVEQFFGVEVRRLRYSDHERYLRLCRAALCELTEEVQGIFRRRRSPCAGALVWQLRDALPGAGWGIMDSDDMPKSAWYGLSRAWSPLGLWIVDEGLEGLRVYADNESPDPVVGTLRVALYRADGRQVEAADKPVEIGPRAQLSWGVDALIGHFVDSSYAYRFGPPSHLVAFAQLMEGDDERARAFYLPAGRNLAIDPGLRVLATTSERDGGYRVELIAERFAQNVAVEIAGYLPSDNHFHLAPGVAHRITLTPEPNAGRIRGTLAPINALAPSSLRGPA